MAEDLKENIRFLKRSGSVLTVFSTGINTLYAVSQGNTNNILFELYDNENEKIITKKLVRLADLTEQVIADLESKARYYC